MSTSTMLRPRVMVPAIFVRQCSQCTRRHTSPVHYKIDGKYFCERHAEDFWGAGHYVEDHRVVRF